ncbi:MAG: hypothetical protein ACYS22_05750 [Planctomycetota bacterium]
MSLLSQLKKLFTRQEIPEETRKLFDSSRSTHDLLRGLDDLLTRNEVEFKELDYEIQKLEALEKAEIDKIKTGEVGGRQKRNVLLHVRRLRKQLDNYEKRLRIYDRNMNLHLSLISKIQDVEAMQLKGVSEQRIDAIIMGFEENLEKYNETMSAAHVLDGTKAMQVSSQEERELAALESELLGPKPVAAEPSVDEALTRLDEPERTEPVQAEPTQAELVQTEAPEPAARPAPRRDPAEIEKLVESELGGKDPSRVPSDDELDRLERQLLEE